VFFVLLKMLWIYFSIYFHDQLLYTYLMRKIFMVFKLIKWF